MSQELRDAKQRLRSGLAQSLAAMATHEARASGLAVRSQLLEWKGFAEAREVACFVSLPGEIDTGPLISAVHGAGKTLLLPRMAGRDLEFAAVEEGEALVEGRYGVLEPDETRDARSVLDRAIVLVPGVAFDWAGGRLGRGAGYYDRALARIREGSRPSVFIGVGFPLQIVDRVPMCPHDVRVDAVLTEEALVWAAPRADWGNLGMESGSQ